MENDSYIVAVRIDAFLALRRLCLETAEDLRRYGRSERGQSAAKRHQEIYHQLEILDRKLDRYGSDINGHIEGNLNLLREYFPDLFEERKHK